MGNWEHKKGGENLDTADHAEMLGWDKITQKVLGVYGATKRGISLAQALKHYGITEEFYQKHLYQCLYESDD